MTKMDYSFNTDIFQLQVSIHLFLQKIFIGNLLHAMQMLMQNNTLPVMIMCS